LIPGSFPICYPMRLSSSHHQKLSAFWDSTFLLSIHGTKARIQISTIFPYHYIRSNISQIFKSSKLKDEAFDCFPSQFYFNCLFFLFFL
jgi:hypothetical protein